MAPMSQGGPLTPHPHQLPLKGGWASRRNRLAYRNSDLFHVLEIWRAPLSSIPHRKYLEIKMIYRHYGY